MRGRGLLHVSLVGNCPGTIIRSLPAYRRYFLREVQLPSCPGNMPKFPQRPRRPILHTPPPKAPPDSAPNPWPPRCPKARLQRPRERQGKRERCYQRARKGERPQQYPPRQARYPVRYPLAPPSLLPVRRLHHLCRPVRLRRALVHHVPRNGPRQVVQARAGHDHERPPLPPQVRAPQVPRRRDGHARHHPLHGLRQGEAQQGPLLVLQERKRERGALGVRAAHRDHVPPDQPAHRRRDEFDAGRDLRALQGVRPADDVLDQPLLHRAHLPHLRPAPPAHPRAPPRGVGHGARGGARVHPDTPVRRRAARAVRAHRRARTTLHFRDAPALRVAHARDDHADAEVVHDAALCRRVQPQAHVRAVARGWGRLCGHLRRGLGEAERCAREARHPGEGEGTHKDALMA